MPIWVDQNGFPQGHPAFDASTAYEFTNPSYKPSLGVLTRNPTDQLPTAQAKAVQASIRPEWKPKPQPSPQPQYPQDLRTSPQQSPQPLGNIAVRGLQMANNQGVMRKRHPEDLRIGAMGIPVPRGVFGDNAVPTSTPYTPMDLSQMSREELVSLIMPILQRMRFGGAALGSIHA